jgi:hypothetical protein
MTHAHRPAATLALLTAFGWITTAAVAAPADDPAAGSLKWTPHRAAVAVPPAAPPAAPAAVATAAPASAPAAGSELRRPPVGPPASVSLPAGVPGAAAPRNYAPLRRSFTPPEMTWAPGWGAGSGVPTSAGIAGFFGRDFTRAPQGDVRRPPAPEWTARAGRTGRPERLAMNAAGVPSVMTRTRQAPAGSDVLPPPDAMLATPGMPGEGMSLDGVPVAPLEGVESIGMPLTVDEGRNATMLESAEILSPYPAYYHVESFFDDPYACEDDECALPVFQHHGRICNWLRQFGKPYYGWRWYRDFTASAGVMSFTNSTDLGINGNYGVNEYLNWAMPFWNAFGVGWQVGARGTQSNFHPTTINTTAGRLSSNARNQVFITTGFFTRAFEGRGLQGGAVYDYLSDSWFDDVDVAQIRGEVSYVWGYHEIGYWGAHNIGDQQGLFGPVTRTTGEASTLDLYTAFYRVQFGDANEWKFYGGGTGEGDGIVGSFVRAPMARSWALEGTFTYVIPGATKVLNVDNAGTTISYRPEAWNVGVNVVFYPAGRARRILSSPYRPLFEVADNGSMIRTIGL